MSCHVNFPIEDVVESVKASIDIESMGGVLESELEQKVLLYIQPKLDALSQRIANIPQEKYVVSQELEGTELIMTLSDDTVITTDLSSLL